MRKDVKAGLAISIVVIIASVWYFWGGSPSEPIALDSGASPAPAVTLNTRPESTPVARTNNRNANRQTAQRPSAESPQQNRQSTRDRGAPRLANRTTERPGDQRVTQTPPSTPTPELLASAGEAATTSDPGSSTGPGQQPAGEPVGPTLDRDATNDATPVVSMQPPAAPESATNTEEVSPSRPRPIDLAQSVSSSSASSSVPKPGEGDAAVETYQVRKGDTLSQIAVIFYGSERYVEFLMQSNPQVASASSIAEGMVLRIPALPDTMSLQAVAAKPAEAAVETAPASGSTYTVKEGDSFYAIALRTLGAGSRWPEIYEINKSVVGKDPAKLRPGTVLKLPAKDATRSDQARSE